MGIFDDNKFIEITQDDVKDAAYSSSNLEERIKQRAFANVIGGRLGIKYLKSMGFNATNQNSLYTIPAVLKDMDISDINIDNVKVDVRIVPNENALFVPKAQYEFNITPDLYIFLVMSEDLSTANFVGAIAPDEVNKSKEVNGYYIVDNGSLYNENSLKKALKKSKPKSNLPTNENDIIKAQALIINFIDGDIMNNEKHFVYEQLMKSGELCEMFRQFQHFELISTDLAHTNEILSDSVLDVLGAQQLYNEDITSDEFGSDVDLDEIANTTVADFVEDYIEENHVGEDTMNLDNNDIINGEFEEKGEEIIEEPGQLDKLPSDEELANFETFEPQEVTEEESFTLEDLAPTANENIPNLNDLGTFEGFGGLEPNLSQSDIDDLTADSIDLDNIDLDAFSDLTQQNNSSNQEQQQQQQQNNETSDTQVSEEIQSIDDIAKDDDINFLDFEDIPDLQDINNNENLDTLDNFANFEDLDSDNIPELEDLTEITNEQMATQDITEPTKENNDTPEEQPSLIDAVKNEGFDIASEPTEMTDLEAFETPIDLTLPELAPDDDLPSLEEITADETLQVQEPQHTQEEIQNTQQKEIVLDDKLETLEPIAPLEDLVPQTLDDIAQDKNFSSPEPNLDETASSTEIQDLPQQFQGLGNDASQDVDLSNFEMNTETTPTETNLQEQAQTETSNNDNDDDMSGLEEFTMDMAAAVEEANPNLNNPQIPVDDAMNDAFSAFNNFTSMSDNSTQAHTSEQSPQETQNSEFENINLDDLDDDLIPDDATSSQSDINPDNIDLDSEIDNLVNSDIDLSEINLDDIDLNDPDIQNIDLDFSDEDFASNTQTPQQEIPQDTNLNNIPDMSAQQDYTNMQFNPDDISNMNNISQGSDNYDPNFAANDQSTIETLYDNTQQQGQMGNDAIDNSLNQNNVNNNYQMPPQKQTKKKTSSPLLGILFIVLIVAFGYTKKDLIMEKINANKGIQTQQDQNMPIEGETQEDKEDAQMLTDTTPENAEEGDDNKQPIGAIPGEAGGPQDVASMNASLNQGKERLTDKNLSTLPSKPQAPLYTNQIKKLYWEVPQELTYNEAIVKYLKITGRTMKFAIQSDLLNASELPYSSKMIVDVQINKSGELTNTNVNVSSGSKQIDAIVLQSVKAALKYVKAPTSEFTKDSYNFSLIINF